MATSQCSPTLTMYYDAYIQYRHIVTSAVFLAGLTTRLTKSARQSSMGVWIWNLVLFDRVPPAVQAVHSMQLYIVFVYR